MQQSIKITQELYNKLSRFYLPEKCEEHEHNFKDMVCEECMIIGFNQFYCEKCQPKHISIGCSSQLISINQWLSIVRQKITSQINSTRRQLEQCLKLDINNIKIIPNSSNNSESQSQGKNISMSISQVNHLVACQISNQLQRSKQIASIQYLQPMKKAKLQSIFCQYISQILQKINDITSNPETIQQTIQKVRIKTEIVKKQLEQNLQQVAQNSRSIYSYGVKNLVYAVLQKYLPIQKLEQQLKEGAQPFSKQQNMINTKILKQKLQFLEKQDISNKQRLMEQLDIIATVNNEKNNLQYKIRQLNSEKNKLEQQKLIYLKDHTQKIQAATKQYQKYKQLYEDIEYSKKYALEIQRLCLQNKLLLQSEKNKGLYIFQLENKIQQMRETIFKDRKQNTLENSTFKSQSLQNPEVIIVQTQLNTQVQRWKAEFMHVKQELQSRQFFIQQLKNQNEMLKRSCVERGVFVEDCQRYSAKKDLQSTNYQQPINLRPSPPLLESLERAKGGQRGNIRLGSPLCQERLKEVLLSGNKECKIKDILKNNTKEILKDSTKEKRLMKRNIKQLGRKPAETVHNQ